MRRICGGLLCLGLASCPRSPTNRVPRGFESRQDFPDTELCSLACAVGWETFASPRLEITAQGWRPKPCDRVAWVFTEGTMADAGSVSVSGLEGSLVPGTSGSVRLALSKNGRRIQTFILDRTEISLQELGTPNTAEAGSWYELRVVEIAGSPVVHDVELAGGH